MDSVSRTEWPTQRLLICEWSGFLTNTWMLLLAETYWFGTCESSKEGTVNPQPRSEFIQTSMWEEWLLLLFVSTWRTATFSSSNWNYLRCIVTLIGNEAKVVFVWLYSLCFTNSKQLMGSFYSRNWGTSREIEVFSYWYWLYETSRSILLFLSLSFHQSPHAKLDSQGTLHIASYHKTKAKPWFEKELYK